MFVKMIAKLLVKRVCTFSWFAANIFIHRKIAYL